MAPIVILASQFFVHLNKRKALVLGILELCFIVIDYLPELQVGHPIFFDIDQSILSSVVLNWFPVKIRHANSPRIEDLLTLAAIAKQLLVDMPVDRHIRLIIQQLVKVLRRICFRGLEEMTFLSCWTRFPLQQLFEEIGTIVS